MTKQSQIWILLLIFAVVIGFLFLQRDRRTSEQANDMQIETVGSELTNQQERAFLNNIAQLCGQTFAGSETFIAEGRESWAHKSFVMHVTLCEDDRVYVPFHLDDDHSRTWMFLVEDGRLRFRHDHRHEDGTPEEVTMYGGYADGNGTSLLQSFPADDYTCEMLPTACNAVWRVFLSDDFSTFSYQLLYGDELLFEGAFDISKNIALDD
ncbi:MAG: hypothetical protein EA394_00355 [Bacteroidia bacterium]|nr:MAG: hypothetical protein EA394_00355 [Bacteroidia bacterium]